jgi:hypothetical protein
MAQSPKFTDIRTPEAAKVYAKSSLLAFGWAREQWSCLEQLWTLESNWRPNAQNRTSVRVNGKKVKAGGIPQILGMNPHTSVASQVNKGLTYIQSRYGTACRALNFHNRQGWY